jgi:hypothetical protein
LKISFSKIRIFLNISKLFFPSHYLFYFFGELLGKKIQHFFKNNIIRAKAAKVTSEYIISVRENK